MRRRRVIIGFVLCVSAAFTIATFWRGPKEPEYNGKKLSEWIAIADTVDDEGMHNPDLVSVSLGEITNAPVREAVAAVRAIGTNALPWLLNDIKHRRENWKFTLLVAYGKFPPILQFDGLARVIFGKPERVGNRPLIGFAILQQQAASAVPELIKLVREPNSPYCRSEAILCLGALGELARPALPHLRTIAPTKQHDLGFWAEIAIRQIEARSPQVVRTNSVTKF